MKNLKHLLFYIFTIGAFFFFVQWIILSGKALEADKIAAMAPLPATSAWNQFTDIFHHNLTHPLAILLLQIITIIAVAWVFGLIFKKIGQPAVIGEIVAGIFLGPSFLGAYFPEFSAFLFPLPSLGNLQFLSQIGLILFMFIVGMELDHKVLKNKAHEAVVISHSSIIFPFALGVVAAYYSYASFAPANVTFLSFALFLGISLSITAFPVLARIVQERGISKTRLGTVVITCAAADDITAWCLLAAVIAIVKAGSFLSSLYTILMAVGYVLVMLKIARPFLKKLGDVYSNKEGLSKPIVAVFFVTLLLSAYTTEVIGIHALFGAFMAGVMMPPNMTFRNLFIEKVEDVAVVLLLPLFFVFTGLRTHIGLLNDPRLWTLCGVIILAAVTGKFLGSALPARFVGQSWRDSLVIGALMNTRGLMELVVLNIGYDLGVLTPEIFAIMVIMALVTTFMTGPALNLINRLLPEKAVSDVPDPAKKYHILVSFGTPQRGKAMVRLANSLIRKTADHATVTALHLSPSTELNQFNMQEYEKYNFSPIKSEAKSLNLPVTTMFKPSHDIDRDIIQTANLGHFDLLLIGIGRSLFEGTLLGKILGFTTKLINPERLYDRLTGKEKLFENTLFDERTRHIVRTAKIPVGILLDKELEKADTLLVPLFSSEDGFLLEYVQKFIRNNDSKVMIADMMGSTGEKAEWKERVPAIEQSAPGYVRMADNVTLAKLVLAEPYDLMMISLDSWKKAMDEQLIKLAEIPSTLIIKP